jgi:hypothetical protein
MRILTIPFLSLLTFTGCYTQSDGTFEMPSDCDTGEDCEDLDDTGDSAGSGSGNGGTDDSGGSGSGSNDDSGGSGSSYNSVARFVAPSDAGSMWCHVSTSSNFDAFMDADNWPPYTASSMSHWSNVVEIEFNAVSGAEVAWGNCTVCPDELDEEPYGAGDGGDAEELGCYWFGYGSSSDEQYELGTSRVEIGDHWFYDTGLLTRNGQTAVIFDLR